MKTDAKLSPTSQAEFDMIKWRVAWEYRDGTACGVSNVMPSYSTAEWFADTANKKITDVLHWLEPVGVVVKGK